VHIKKILHCTVWAVNSRKPFAYSCTRKLQNQYVTAGLLTRSVLRRLPNQTTGQWQKSVAIWCLNSRNLQQRELFGIYTRFPF